MDKLKSRRGAHKGTLTKLSAIVEKHETNQTPLTINQVDGYLEQLVKTELKLDEINETIFEECDDQTRQAAVDESTDIMTNIVNIRDKFLQIKKALTPTPSSSSSSTVVSSQNSQSTVGFKKLDPPSFDGKFEDWKSFEDLFLAAVGNNSSYSSAQKLQYLKSSIKGDAALIIKSITIGDGNYDEAWDLLKERYNNPRDIVASHIHTILHQSPIKFESATALQKLIDVTEECRRALKVMKIPVDKWDIILIQIMTEKVDNETRKEWAKSLTGTNIPTYAEFKQFLQQHVRGLQAAGPSSYEKQENQKPNNQERKNQSSSSSSSSSSSNQTCIICKQTHPLYHCSEFKSLKPDQRFNKIKNNSSICRNCLNYGHSTKDCQSKSSCKNCQQRHHTFIHFEKKDKNETRNNGEQGTSANIMHLSSAPIHNQPLLRTAIINVQDKAGQLHQCRAFLDEGADRSLITEACAAALGLQRTKAHVNLSCVQAASIGTAKSKVHLKISSIVAAIKFDCEALIVPKVTNPMPPLPCDSSQWAHLQGLKLADPTYNIPSKIDILLGSDIVLSLLRPGLIQSDPKMPVAQNTALGWVIGGNCSSGVAQEARFHHLSTTDLHTSINKFWEVEDIPQQSLLTQEEKQCEQHFEDTHSRHENGRYVVSLPFKPNVINLGTSRDQAMRRFLSLEKRLTKMPEYKEQYHSFMREYLELGHMRQVNNSRPNGHFYLPHHFVIQESRPTTKLRVVFDGSAKSSSGMSLNDTLMVGPTIQDSLFSLLIRFRTHPIAIKADIAKMYRQFLINANDLPYQTILWRWSEKDPIQEFQLLTVTYGTASAPFLATRALKQLALDHMQKFPLAAKAILNDTYVDDLTSGGESVVYVIHLINEMTLLLREAGLEMRKYVTNNEQVYNQIDPSIREAADVDFNENPDVATLGAKWRPTTDSFIFTPPPNSTRNTKITKRVLLSHIAKVFDPLGMLSPVTVKAKILFQSLWLKEVGWDDELQPNILSQWHKYENDLEKLDQLTIPRFMSSVGATSYEIIGFSDSSEKAYAAVVYLRALSNADVLSTHIICSKSKVAPIKQLSLPRLELCGALLLTELLAAVKEALPFSFSIHCMTDSTLVLNWLASYPGRWKTFIANRVAKIQDAIPYSSWSHVKGEENPADLPTRGITAEELVHSEMWKHGPHFLQEINFPKSIPGFPKQEEMEAEEKQITVRTHAMISFESHLNQYADLPKLVRMTAYCKRFQYNCSHPNEKRTGPIGANEYKETLKHLIRTVQADEFQKDVKALKEGKEVRNESRLKQLSPFLDSEGIIRVGGRTTEANIPEDMKYQIALPHDNPLTRHIMWECHLNNKHSGFQLTYSTLQQKYWILRGRDTIRNFIRRCALCRKRKAKVNSQLMANLHPARTQPNPPFFKCGVDYAGPFLVLKQKGRGERTFKCYFAIYVCYSTKAVHLEYVTDLTSEGFIACFRRFCSRRGLPAEVHSDCGTNFIGAERELMELQNDLKFQEDIIHDGAEQGINWIFNPPSAPHHGGLWEAGVKSVKYHLTRTLGSTHVTLEEFGTILCQIEGILNSRPLSMMSPDPTDLHVLTPGHFLIGRPLNSVPDTDLTEVKMNRLSRWQRVQQVVQHFWKRWQNEYLINLQQRYKWTQKKPNADVGDVVLIKEDNYPPMHWKMGRIITANPASDGIVRIVTLKTATGTMDRPITKLSPIIPYSEQVPT